MGGVWVFPGGAVDAHEGEGDGSHRLAAVRELEEEAGIDGVDPEALVKFSRWITPRQVAIRFDTHFFLAPLPDGQEPAIDGEECVDLGWFTPRGALDAHVARASSRSSSRRSSTSSSSTPFASADELLAHAARTRRAAGRAARRDGGRGRARAAPRRAGVRRRAPGMDAVSAWLISTQR